MDLVDEGVRDTTEAKAAGEQGRIGFHVFDGFGGGGKDFVDFMPAEGGGEMAGEDGLVLELAVSCRVRGMENSTGQERNRGY